MPGPVTDPRAGALLRRYRELFGGPDLPVPVNSIAEDLLGLSVEEQELEVSGMLLPTERRVILNAQEGGRGERHRFTLAHEIGHWICHCTGANPQPVFCRAKDVSEGADRTLEREANVFAAELLMPQDHVQTAWSGSVEDCASRFRVSPSAMRWRLYSFGLTGPPS